MWDYINSSGPTVRHQLVSPSPVSTWMVQRLLTCKSLNQCWLAAETKCPSQCEFCRITCWPDIRGHDDAVEILKKRTLIYCCSCSAEASEESLVSVVRFEFWVQLRFVYKVKREGEREGGRGGKKGRQRGRGFPLNGWKYQEEEGGDGETETGGGGAGNIPALMQQTAKTPQVRLCSPVESWEM